MVVNIIAEARRHQCHQCMFVQIYLSLKYTVNRAFIFYYCCMITQKLEYFSSSPSPIKPTNIDVDGMVATITITIVAIDDRDPRPGNTRPVCHYPTPLALLLSIPKERERERESTMNLPSPFVVL